MFLKKRKFFNRDNRDFLYRNYKYAYYTLDSKCQDFNQAVEVLEAFIEKTSNKKHIHDYLITIRESAPVSICEDICLSFTRSKNDKSDFTIEAFVNLPSTLSKLAEAIDTIYSATDLVCYLNNNDLTIRKK